MTGIHSSVPFGRYYQKTGILSYRQKGTCAPRLTKWQISFLLKQADLWENSSENIFNIIRQPIKSFWIVECGFQRSYDGRNSSLISQYQLIYFNWVRRHSGVAGNELANTLAKEAAQKHDFSSSFIPFPTSYLKTQLNQNSISKWQLQWNTADVGTCIIFFQ